MDPCALAEVLGKEEKCFLCFKWESVRTSQVCMKLSTTAAAETRGGLQELTSTVCYRWFRESIVVF